MFKLRILVSLVITLLLAGCGGISLTGSGTVITQEETITGFNKLEVDHGFQVDVSQGDTFSVVIRVDDNLQEHLQVVKEGGTLKIDFEPGRSYELMDATLEADVTMPELIGLDQKGGSHVTINGFKSAVALDAVLSGGSHLEGDVEAGDVTFNLSGGSQVTLSGSAGDLMIEAGGGSYARLADLAVVNVSVDASGGSQVTVNPGGRLDAIAKGGSDVTYLGSPTLGTIDTDGSSSVKQQ